VIDLGPDGVYLPHAANAEEVAGAIAAMKFAPAGTRSASLSSRAARLGGAAADIERYKTETNRHLITWVQIEDAEAVREIDAIASVPGVDICGIAPLDLSRSLGCRAHADDPVLQAAVAKVAASIREHGHVHLAIPAIVFGAQRALELGAAVVNVADVYQTSGRALKSTLGDVLAHRSA
jgi:4-hydroxy-2-oxoheptanedioate aldolase